jgi:hypothetical protein
MIRNATEYANVLSDVIESKKLYTLLSGKKHVNIEGWTTLGTMLGFLPRELSVIEHADGTYEATVQLYNMHNGQIVGQASSICGSDERTWAGRPKYARRSMAITRATGKAYRLGFGWVMSLAGYSPTPEEEMVDIPVEETKKPPAKKPPATKPEPTASVYTGTSEQQQKLEPYLKKAALEDSKWERVHELMLGRPSSDIHEIIAKVAMEGVFE